MSGVYLLIGTFFIVAVILVTVVLVLIQKHRYNSFRKEVEELDKAKNMIASTPVLSELSKVESIVKNDKMEEKYKNWQKRFEVIKDDKINQINDMINELDISTSQKDYKNIDQKLAKVEMEIYKVRESANELLNEIQEVTVSEEKYRSIVTKLKAKYRKLVNEFNNHKSDYEDISDAIELQLENIEKRFLDFEHVMEKNEYDEVVHIVKALDTMIDHMGVVIVEVPNLVLLAEKLIPKRIEEIVSISKDMTENGYNLEYLNLDYNMDECNKNVSVILDRVRVLNLEDCMFELKTMLDYLDSIFNNFDQEKLARKNYEELSTNFEKNLKKTNRIMKDIYGQLDDIKGMYDLSDDDISELNTLKTRLTDLTKDYKKMVAEVNSASKPYSVFFKQLDAFNSLLHELETSLDTALKSLGSMYDDEIRAREQLEEIKDLLKQCKVKIRSYKLPIIINNYFVELSEANDAIDEIVKELEKKPIIIKTLNTRVDTARDLVLKLYNTTTDMIKTAQLAEMAIVYGNRYRSEVREVDKGLENAEMLYLKGNYKDALEVSISSIELIESDIHKKLLDLYQES
ncbi:MAG: septation ring formation regulator EzrA [Tenericutes bacterium]|nr:septation ring formation regulator EzrA [Mycoplasmatota bacterium]